MPVINFLRSAQINHPTTVKCCNSKVSYQKYVAENLNIHPLNTVDNVEKIF